MRVMVVAIAFLICSLPKSGGAESPPIPASTQTVPGSEEAPLPAGKEVSRPLTPVEIDPDAASSVVEPESAKPSPVQRVEDVQDQQYVRRGPLGPGWDDFEFLLWWPKAQPLPPLITGSRSAAPPILGSPSTALLLGGHMLQNQDIAGGRFTIGASINSEETVGIEAVYFFLGSRSLSDTVYSRNNLAADSLGLPFVNSATGQRDVFIIASPGVSTGSVYFSSTTRVQGAESNVVANLYDSQTFKVNGILGYRFLEVNEGIAIEDMRTQIGGQSQYGPIYDGFDGHNQFNGGQFGLHVDYSHGLVFCEFTGKVAIGITSEVVKIDGATTIYTPGPGGVSAQTLPGGVYALPSNIGRYSRGEFAVVPEGLCKMGLKLGDVSRFFVGYNFLYLSDLARPADQIDRTLNPVQIASLNSGGSFSGADRPHVPFVRSDFWTQGLVIGLETRY
jgi:hypothetical protein